MQEAAVRLACVLVSLFGVASAAAAGDAPVQGLIVELRDAPTHVALARERAQSAGAAATVQRESQRWSALLAETAALPRLRARDPVGARAQVLRFEQPMGREQAQALADRLAQRGDVAWVTLNTREKRQAIANNPPNDPLFAGLDRQWWLFPVQGSNGNAPEGRLRGVPGFQTAWLQKESGSAAAVVAVLDTGITAHPELAGRVLPGYDFVSDSGYANDGNGRDADPSDPGDWVDAADRSRDPARFSGCEPEFSSWHGTVMAGMVAGLTSNGAGVAAINWSGRVLPVRVAGKCGAEVADIVDGMRWAAGLAVCNRGDGAGGCAEFAPVNANPARIVNISFGGSAACGSAYQSAIDELRALPNGGAVVIAAAGNGHAALSRPANCTGAIGVVALNRDGFKTTYSNFGAQAVVATVGGDDVDTAGDDGIVAKWNALADSGLLSIGNDGNTSPGIAGYYFHYGTSFSTPVVAGAVSLMLSRNPNLTAAQIIDGLRRSARPHAVSPLPGVNACSDANPGRCLCTTATCGAGILDAVRALDYADNPTGYAPSALTAASIDTPELRAAAALGPDLPPNPVPPPSNGGGGGGSTSPAFLLALAMAAALLRRIR